MDVADLLMNYPRVKGQVKAFQSECGSDKLRDYQVKWKLPRWFPFTVRLDLRYLPSYDSGTYQKVLPLSDRKSVV